MDPLDDKIETDMFGSGNQTIEHQLMQNARGNFVRKVYSILALQLLVVSGVVSLSTFNDDFRKLQQNSFILLGLSFVACLASSLTLALVKGMTTLCPINYMLLCIFTLSKSYLVGFISARYTPESILNAAAATLGATVFLTCYAIYTKSDFSSAYSRSVGFFWSFFGMSLALTILNVYFLQLKLVSILIAIGIGLVYSVYLIIDTQLILGGRKRELSLDDYILGAMMLYIDIIELFLQLLRIFGEER